MRAPTVLQALTPWGRIAAAALVLAALLLVGHGLGLRWDPFNVAERRLKATKAQAAAATADAAARRLEIEGAEDQRLRTDAHHQQTAAVERATVRAATEARNAHDASILLGPDRAARLAGHDRELCRLAPAVCPAAAPYPSDGGDDAVRAGDPA